MGDELRQVRAAAWNANLAALRATAEAKAADSRAQRHLAVAADAELRRRHPSQHYPPLRSAEPQPATGAQLNELTLTASRQIPQMGQWLKDLTVGHHTFAGKLAERQSLTIPSEDPAYGDLGQAFPPWPRPARDAILQPPKPEIRPSPRSSSAPQTATPTRRPQIDSTPVHPEIRR